MTIPQADHTLDCRSLIYPGPMLKASFSSALNERRRLSSRKPPLILTTDD